LDNKKLFSLKFDQNSLEEFLCLSAGSVGEKKTIPADPAEKSTKGIIVIKSLNKHSVNSIQTL
jgi:hypothetical protein